MVKAQAWGQAPVAMDGFVLYIQRTGDFACIGESLEWKDFGWQRCQAGVQIADITAHMVQAVRYLVGPVAIAQSLVGLQASLPGAFTVGVVAHAQR